MAARSVKWTGASAVVTTVMQLLQRIILANLLIPADFGLVGMVIPVIAFAQAFSDMGISQAIIQREENTREQLSSLYWLNIASGGIAFILVLLAAPLAIDFYDEPRLQELFIWMALIFLVTPLGQQFQMLMQKELQFDTLARLEISAVIVGTVVGIVAALADAGALSLVWATLSTAVVKALLLMIIGWRTWRPHLHFRFSDTTSYLSFGMFQMGERLVNYFATNIDYVIIGRYWGEETLGLYTMAYQLVVMPYWKLNPILTRVAFPLFVKRQHDNTSLRRGYLDLLRLVAIMIFPMVAGLAVVAPIFVPLALGDGWEQTIVIIQILAVLGMLKSLGNPSGSILLAKGRPDIGFYYNLVMVGVNGAVFLMIVSLGVEALALSYVAVNACFFVVGWDILRRLIGLTWHDLSILAQPLAATLMMALAVRIFLTTPFAAQYSDILVLSGAITLGGGVYIIISVLLMRPYLNELRRLILNRQKQHA